MNYLISGYFGFNNAGDEAVLAAMLGHLAWADPAARVTATSGDPGLTTTQHGCLAVGRDKARELLSAMRASHVVLSGGGSLLQDVTSVRNVVYYTGLVRMARLLRRPVMMYAQGVGPLRQPLSRKLARAAFENAQIATVRDPDSLELLRTIGVRREVLVTADPVWDLKPGPPSGATPNSWVVALRSWPGAKGNFLPQLVQCLRDNAAQVGARLRFLPMQPGRDHEVLHGLCSYSELIETQGKSPAEIYALAGSGSLMVAMRLHALIFGAAQGLPVVALNYDPKVASLAALIGAPLLSVATPDALNGLAQLVREANPPAPELLEDFKARARHNATLAATLTARVTPGKHSRSKKTL